MESNCKARRGLRALVVATVIGLTLGTTLAGAATRSTNRQHAQRGGQWLANQIKHNGGFLKSGGVADYTDTAYAVIGMRAAGVDKGASDLAVHYLETKITTQLRLEGHDSAGAIAQYIMAAVSDGVNPRQFGGTAPINDLIARLIATQRTTAPNAGLFGAQDPSFDGAFREGLALAALRAARVRADDSHVIAAISWLKRQQCHTGLWQAYRARPTTACFAANLETFSGPDTNSTAMAIQGLAAYGRFPRRHNSLVSLRAVQSRNGGFPYLTIANQASDPNSTALVIQALVADSDAPGAAWQKGANNPYSALASYQFGCANANYGAFFFPGLTGPNVFATVEAVPAMAGAALPVAPSSTSRVFPLTHC